MKHMKLICSLSSMFVFLGAEACGPTATDDLEGEAVQALTATPCPAVVAPPNIVLIGDSTVATNSGWGDFLQSHFKAGSTVTNSAFSGTSSRSFYNARWPAVRNMLRSGDYLLIQFGHNDPKAEPRYTDPGVAPNYTGSYRTFLELYINEAKARGVTPILVTSVSEMIYWSTGALRWTHGLYPSAARRTAALNDVALLDLESRSHSVFNNLGEAETLRLYAEPIANADRTHFPPEKAFRVTQMVADLLRASPSPLRCALLPSTVQLSNVSVTTGRSYVVVENGLTAGGTNTCYTDRDFTFSSVPAALVGATFIRTANDDKRATASPLLSFSIDRAATVYVGLDQRVSKPSWMSDFTKTTDTLAFSGTGTGTLELYQKSFPAGVVQLGPNGSNGTSSVSMYTVVVR